MNALNVNVEGKTHISQISPPVWQHVMTNLRMKQEVGDNDTAQFKGNAKQALVQAVL